MFVGLTKGANRRGRRLAGDTRGCGAIEEHASVARTTSAGYGGSSHSPQWESRRSRLSRGENAHYSLCGGIHRPADNGVTAGVPVLLSGAARNAPRSPGADREGGNQPRRGLPGDQPSFVVWFATDPGREPKRSRRERNRRRLTELRSGGRPSGETSHKSGQVHPSRPQDQQ